MKANCFVFTVWCVIVAGIFGVTDEESAVEGESFTLRTDIKKQPQETLLWNYEDTRIAQINRDPSTSCVYDGPDGRFKNRLEVDYETGFMTIENIRLEDAGRYEAETIGSESLGRSQRLNRNGKCDSKKNIPKIQGSGSSIKIIDLSVTGSGPSTGVVAGVVVVVVLLVFIAVPVVGVIYYRRRSSRKENETNKGLLGKKDKDEVCVACENPTT